LTLERLKFSFEFLVTYYIPNVLFAEIGSGGVDPPNI